MLFRKQKNAGRSITALVVIGLVFAIFASSASAECGPGFSNKQQLIQYYKHNPAAAHGFRKWLLNHKAYTGYQADETVLNWLRSPEQKVFNAPSGYVLEQNTYCPNGEGQYKKYNGLLNNMSGRPMLWHCDKEGKNCVPVLKGYCQNAVKGPPVKKHKPKKCKCKKKHHKKHKKSCQAQGKVNVNGNCVVQTNTASAEQNCKATVNGQWNGSQCVIVQIQVNADCSNVTVGNEGNVNQGGNCNNGGEETCVGQNNCNTQPPPCECTPPKEPEPPKVSLEKIQEVITGHSRPLCATVTPTSSVSSVQFEVEYGERSNGGKGVYNASANKFCVTYTAPTEEPPHTCVEPISSELPPGTKCDVVEVTVLCNNGAKSVTVKGEIPIIAEEKAVVWNP